MPNYVKDFSVLCETFVLVEKLKFCLVGTHNHIFFLVLRTNFIVFCFNSIIEWFFIFILDFKGKFSIHF